MTSMGNNWPIYGIVRVGFLKNNLERHYIRSILALAITQAKIITNIMPTNVKNTIKYSSHQLFLNQSKHAKRKTK